MGEKNYKTLWSKNGQINIKDDAELPDIAGHFSSWTDKPRQDQFYVLNEFLKSELSQTKKNWYVTHDEFEGLKQRMQTLEQKLEILLKDSTPKNIDSILEMIMLKIGKKSDRIYYRCTNNNLTIYMLLANFSKKCLDELSKAEVELSKIRSDICIEIEPVVDFEDIPEGSHKITVKK